MVCLLLCWDYAIKIFFKLHKNWSFLLRISSVNVNKSTGNCEFGHIYWRNPSRKTSVFVQCLMLPLCALIIRLITKISLILPPYFLTQRMYDLHWTFMGCGVPDVRCHNLSCTLYLSCMSIKVINFIMAFGNEKSWNQITLRGVRNCSVYTLFFIRTIL